MWGFGKKVKEPSSQTLEKELFLALEVNQALKKFTTPDNFKHFQYGNDFKKNMHAMFSSGEFGVDVHQQLKSYLTNATDYASVYAIANSIASLPPKLFRKKSDGTLEEVPFHPSASPLIERVNPFYTWYDYIEGLVTLTELAGFAVTEVVNPPDPKELWLTRPDQTRVITNRMGLAGFELRSNGGLVKLNTEEAFQTKYFNPLDLMRGVSAYHAISRSLSADLFSQQFVNAYFRNGGNVGGMVETDQQIDFNSDEFKNFQAQFKELYDGSSKAFKTLFLPNQMKYQKINNNPKEADVSDIRKMNRMEILSARGVPPILIGHLDGASYANADIQIKMYFKDTILPKKEKYEAALNAHVFSKWGLMLKFDTSGVAELQEGGKENAETAKVMSESGVFTLDEIRKESFNYSPLKEGQGTVIVNNSNTNMIQIGKQWQNTKTNNLIEDSSAYEIARLLGGQGS